MKPADQLNLIPPGGMFTALAPLAKKGQIMLMLSSETDKLRVNLTVKADKAADALSLALLGTPAELDAELPAALAKARGDAPVLASVADQVAEQIDSKPAAAKKAAPAKRPAAAKKTKIVKPRPAARKQSVKSAAKPKAKTAARAKFTKDQCLAEYVRLKGIHGDKLTMDLYAKNAQSAGGDIGRSFERMFSGWKKFAKAGEKRIAATAPPAANSTRAAPVASDATVSGPVPIYLNEKLVHSMPKGEFLNINIGDLFEIAGFGRVRLAKILRDRAVVEAAPQPMTASKTDGRIFVGRDVYDTEGRFVAGATTVNPTVNELLKLEGHPPMKVIAVGKTRITVEVAGETAGA